MARYRPLIAVTTQTLQSIDGIPAGLPQSVVMNQRYYHAVTLVGAVPALVMAGVTAVSTTASDWLPVPAALVALIVTLVVPLTVGVPEMTTVAVLTTPLALAPAALTPGGRFVTR